MESILLIKKDGRLIPAYDSDRELLSKVPDGEMIEAKYEDQRRLQFHRRFFAMLRCTLNHIPEKFGIDNEGELLNRLKIKLGHYKTVVYNGEHYMIADSISFKSMGQVKFERFYSGALDIILRDYLSGISQEDFENDILNFM